MKPKIIHISEKKVIGMQSTMRHNEYGNIVALWKRFMPRIKTVESVVNREFIAMQVYGDFNSLEKPFDIWACAEVVDFKDNILGMTSFTISGGDYAVFLQKGMDATGTYQHIMTEWLPNSGYKIDDRPHFQVMGKKYKNGSPDSEEDFYIPIKSIMKD